LIDQTIKQIIDSLKEFMGLNPIFREPIE